MSSNCRRISTNQHPLRKQVSLVDSSVPNASLVIPRSHAVNIRRVDRFKFANFQKQFSVDQVFAVSRGVRQKTVGQNTLRVSVTKGTTVGYSKACDGNAALPSHQQCDRVGEPGDANLKIVPALKKRVQPRGYDDRKKDKVNAERTRKQSKAEDDRYNLKIFLDPNISSKDSNGIEGEESSSSSSEETDSEQVSESETGDVQKRLEQELKDSKLKPVDQSQRFQPSASARRAQFQASRGTVGNPAFSVVSALSLTVERRTPLVRAMSAPIRPHDENSKATLANKRKIRRRKISGRPTSSTFSQISENGVVESKTPESVDTSAEQSKAKGGKKSIARTRPTLGCDVVTLVSLISSEGSDSEKEESLIAIDSSRLKRPPLLRKSGKSVSFQEHDINNFSNTAKEFPHMIRRGSVAPLAARIRANRPPTAPPGSIFVHGFEASEPKMSIPRRTASKEDLTTITSTQGSSKENVSENNNTTNDTQYPEYVRSLKERECWKLFQKMMNKGVTISYDTILRGMLTPTELRLIQKQKELEEARKNKELEEVGERK